MSANKCCEIILGQSTDDKTHLLIGWLYSLVLTVTADKTSLLITSPHVFPSFVIFCFLLFLLTNMSIMILIKINPCCFAMTPLIGLLW